MLIAYHDDSITQLCSCWQ